MGVQMDTLKVGNDLVKCERVSVSSLCKFACFQRLGSDSFEKPAEKEPNKLYLAHSQGS